MDSDFLARAYVPHLALAVAAVAVCTLPHPSWPDEAWVKQYEYLDWRYQRFLKRSAEARPGAEQNRAHEEWCHECQLADQVDARITAGRSPVYASLLLRTAILAALTALCYVLTDSLVSRGERMLLLPHGQSYFLLACCAFLGAFVTLLAARADAGLGAGMFLLSDGLALTCLLAARNAHGAFKRVRWDAVCRREARRAELQGGTTGARLEAERYFTAHRHLLRKAVPEALWRASINAAIPEGTDAVEAWAAARKLIKQLQPHIEEAQRLIREEQERARQRARDRQELLAEVGRCTAQIEEVRGSPLDEDVIRDEVSGLQYRIGQLKKQLEVLDSLNDEGDQK